MAAAAPPRRPKTDISLIDVARWGVLYTPDLGGADVANYMPVVLFEPRP